MQARDFNPLDVARLSTSSDALVQALRQWQAAWGICQEVHVHARAAHEAAPLPAAQTWWRASGDAWLGADPAFETALARQLFSCASSGASSIAGAVAADARTELLAAIGAALQCAEPFDPVPGEAPQESLRRGSGAVALLVRIGGLQLHVIRDKLPSQRRARASIASPCVPAPDALRHCNVGMLVTVGKLQLRLESLASIGVGDVLRLDRRLDEPALVTVDDGTPLCNGYLGSNGPHRALSLFRADGEPAETA